MKITRVKFYQAVSIHNGQKFQLVTHLNMDKPEISGKLELSIVDGVGLKVKTDGESTIITFNNVAFINFVEDEEPKEKPKAAASKKA